VTKRSTFRRTIEDHIDVGVASGHGPWELRRGLVTESYSSRASPTHYEGSRTADPISVTASVTTQIALPALDAMDAAPRTVLESDLLRGGLVARNSA